MNDDLAEVKSHYSAGRTEEALAALRQTILYRKSRAADPSELVEIKSGADFLGWCRRNAEDVTPPPPPTPEFPAEVYYVEGDTVVARPLEFVDADPSVFVIPDAKLFAGQGLLSTADNSILLLQPTWGEKVKDISHRAFGLVAAREGADEVLCTRFPEGRVIPEAISLWVGSKHYFANLLSLAGMAVLKDAIGDSNAPLISRGVGATPKPFELDVLRKMGFEDNELIILEDRPTTRVERLWIPYVPLTFLAWPIVNSSAAVGALRRRLGIGTPRGSTSGERIYVSRRDATRRYTRNEERLLEILAQYGFETVEFSDLDVEGKIRALENAKVVLGPVGSNLFNTIFAPAGCWVLEYTPPFYDVDPIVRDSFANFSMSMGLRYMRVPCDIHRTEEKWTLWDLSIREQEMVTALDYVTAALDREKAERNAGPRILSA